ncbi:MAG: porin, partial [Nitrospirae bacterium]
TIAEGAPGHRTNLFGSYTQAGYFFHYLIPIIPKPLETAFRYAFVDPNIAASGDFRQEFTGALNWFFAGHRNKLTLDVSHLTLDQVVGNNLTEQRIRLQWDVSF